MTYFTDKMKSSIFFFFPRINVRKGLKFSVINSLLFSKGQPSVDERGGLCFICYSTQAGMSLVKHLQTWECL